MQLQALTSYSEAPRAATRLELLGSWDNFSKPYPMQRDRSLGCRDWKGCHSFTDIICDGEAVSAEGSKRDGGLRMGGTYWYYVCSRCALTLCF
jgi:hypothetical protein